MRLKVKYTIKKVSTALHLFNTNYLVRACAVQMRNERHAVWPSHMPCHVYMNMRHLSFCSMQRVVGHEKAGAVSNAAGAARHMRNSKRDGGKCGGAIGGARTRPLSSLPLPLYTYLSPRSLSPRPRSYLRPVLSRPPSRSVSCSSPR